MRRPIRTGERTRSAAMHAPHIAASDYERERFMGLAEPGSERHESAVARQGFGLMLVRLRRDDDDLVLAHQAKNRAGSLVQHVGVDRLRAQELGLMSKRLTHP